MVWAAGSVFGSILLIYVDSSNIFMGWLWDIYWTRTHSYISIKKMVVKWRYDVVKMIYIYT